MRQIALGRMNYSPQRFGRMRLGDWTDAMIGYLQGQESQIKAIANLIRTSTALLWNVQVAEESRLAAEDLWKFTWDMADDSQATAEPSQEDIEQRQKLIERHEQWLKDK